jgi:hypothetical protein
MTRARDLAAFVSNADGDIKFDTDTLFIDSSANRVGILNTTPSHDLDVTQTGSTSARVGGTGGSGANDGTVIINNGGTGDAMLRFDYETNTDRARIGTSTSSQQLEFYTAGNNERMRIDNSGNVLVGKTAQNHTDVGHTLYPAGGISVVRSGGQCAVFNRTTSNGTIVDLRKDGSSFGSIGVAGGSSNEVFIYASAGRGVVLNPNGLLPADSSGNGSDNTTDLGQSGVRYDDVYATNGTIQTSDQNEKQQIASLTDAEMTAAKAISKLFKTFKWKNKVTEKGDNARTHAGVIAQQVEAAMSDAGLDAGNYAFFISTTWWEVERTVPAVEANEAKMIEAREEYIEIDNYHVQSEAPEGATERNRKGIRYPELLSFIGAATEQRLTSIEARLDALEAG